MQVTLIFPNQLFQQHPAVHQQSCVYLIEEYLFFRQFDFLKQKLVYQRACMKNYAASLVSKNIAVTYIDSTDDRADVRKLISYLAAQGVTKILCCDVADDWLSRRIIRTADARNIRLEWFDSPQFLNTRDQIRAYQPGKTWFHASFYQQERKRLSLLLDEHQKPIGGKWSFDTDNRKAIPSGYYIPQLPQELLNNALEISEAKEFIDRHYPENYGSVDMLWRNGHSGYFPVSHDAAKEWLSCFLKSRFTQFGPYEDAIIPEENLLFHSGVSPMLNNGLLVPDDVVSAVLQFADENQIAVSSVEGFIRQIIGWREFMRLIYERTGRTMRLENHFGFTHRPLPDCMYDGTTGIQPVDVCIRKVNQVGYLHHIERLMVVGNFLLLCEAHPDAVYQWFMELFLDAYDWVMVPNVYGMSQFADGGKIITKPYISGSNYLMNMGRFRKGAWQEIWDALFWRFVSLHRSTFEQNIRSRMMVHTLDRMDKEKRQHHLDVAASFLKTFWKD